MLPVPRLVTVERLDQVRHAVDDGASVENDGRTAIDAVLHSPSKPVRRVLSLRHAGVVEVLDPTERFRLRSFGGSWEAFG